MHILYIHQYFKTPSDPGGTRSYWVGREMVKAGHRVTVLTASAEIEGSVQTVSIDSHFNVIYLNVPYSQSMGIFQRALSFVGFMLKSSVIAFRQKQVDLVFATSTPITVGFPALLLKTFKRIPYVFEVRDLWPEVPIQMGALKSRMLIYFLRKFESSIYKNASHIIALSPGMQDGVHRCGISLSKISMVPNMSKVDIFFPREIDESIYNKYQLQRDTFKVVYFGSMGIANGMQYLLDAIECLREDRLVEFVLMGGGSTEAYLKKQCEDMGANNVHFLGNICLQELAEIVNVCDVSLVTFADLPILATNSPNKFFDSLSAGKAIVVNSPGWTKDLVEQYNCGIFVDPGDPQALVNGIRYLYGNKGVCDAMGANARKLAETEYDKSILCRRIVDSIDKLNYGSEE